MYASIAEAQAARRIVVSLAIQSGNLYESCPRCGGMWLPTEARYSVAHDTRLTVDCVGCGLQLGCIIPSLLPELTYESNPK